MDRFSALRTRVMKVGAVRRCTEAERSLEVRVFFLCARVWGPWQCRAVVWQRGDAGSSCMCRLMRRLAVVGMLMRSSSLSRDEGSAFRNAGASGKVRRVS